MKNNKIALRLSLNFIVTLVVFSVIIGSVFLLFFKNYTVRVHKEELKNYALSLSSAISSQEKGFRMGMNGLGAYLHFINEVANTDVWLVNENGDITIANMGQRMHNQNHHNVKLPLDVKGLIDEAFLGKTVFSEGYNDTQGKVTLTVAAPIIKGDRVTGAVILHSPVEGTDLVVRQGAIILIGSMLLASVIAVGLTFFISYSFTKPLRTIKNTALQLSKKDYSVRSSINQNDEIGELSGALDLLANRLQEASLESEKLEGLRRNFVANISHELKTPITVIRGSLEAICDNVVTDKEMLSQYHISMLNEAKFLQRLVGDLLDLSKLQSTDFVMDMIWVNPCELIFDSIRAARHLADKKGIEIEFITDNSKSQVMGDYGRLRQMFLIILDNAVKFSLEGEKITVTFKENVVSIRDRGNGIDTEHLPYIFDRFYKTKGETNKEGTGLGLSIAKQIATRHNIGLSACNSSEKGAMFIFTFPL